MNYIEILVDIGILWFLAEILFFLVITVAVHSSLQKLRTPPAYDIHPVTLVNRILHDIDRLEKYTFKGFFSGFFCGANFEDIKMDNVRSFMAWVMYAKNVCDLTSAQNEEMETTIANICKRYNVEIGPGYNYNVRHCKMTLEPLLFTHRPLALYLISGVKAKITDFFFMMKGFQRNELNKITYWHCPAHPGMENLPPVAMFHGITTGWDNYSGLIEATARGRETFLFDLDAVKVNSLNFSMPSAELFAETVRTVLDNYKVKKVSVYGHSFGSITSGWFAKQYPEYVFHYTLIDPVCLMLGLPDVAINFLYRKPSTIVEWVIYLFASQEVTIANALRRNFWWYKNVLWLEDLPHSIGVVVSLAGGDEVCDPVAVRDYVSQFKAHREAIVAQQESCANKLTIGPVSCLYFDGQSHAEIMFRPSGLREVASTVQQHEKMLLHSGAY